MTRAIPAILFAPILSLVLACEPGDQPGPEYMPDMARGPAYKAFAPNQATRNGITLQRPVVGTIKRGYEPFHYGKGEAEAVRAGAELNNPFHATAPVLAKGKALFEIYCLVCHGEQGKGDGPISSKIPPPPSYKSDRLLQFPPGRIFHVITMGSNKMPSYAAQLAPEERWQVVTYVRAELQGLPEASPVSPPAPEPAPAPPGPGVAPTPASGSTPPAAPAPPASGSKPPASPASPASGSKPPAPAPPAPPASGSAPAPVTGSGSGGRP
jgi:mono/diheme cytochrome c family protein